MSSRKKIIDKPKSLKVSKRGYDKSVVETETESDT